MRIFKPILRLVNSLSVGNLWLSVLSLAAREPIYAYRLPDDIRSRFRFRPSRLTVYLVLYKLEGEGLLRSSEKGQRRYYILTPDGRRCLSEGRQTLMRRAREI